MQTRTLSAVETITSTLTGLAVSMALTAWIMPLYGFHPTVGENAQITAIFTAASIARGYIIRRLFNRRRDDWAIGYQWAASALLAGSTTTHLLLDAADSHSDHDRGVRAAVRDYEFHVGL